jgi:very-short-patch-repair endonuclease
MAPKKRSDRRFALEGLASSQCGVTSRAQLRVLGMSDDGIKHAIETGRLHAVYRSVYAVGRREIGKRGRLFAATLACGEGAVISHRSAAALMGLLDRGPASIDVIAPGWQGRKIDGIRRHDVRRPQSWETGTYDGIPCTSPARTLVDLAGVVGARTLRSAFERAAARKLLDVEAIEASIGPGGRRGTPALRGLLDEWRPAAAVAKTARLKSPLEAKILPLLAKRDLPMPLANVPVDLAEGRIEVDFLWPDHRFVLEADSRAFHATDVASERDRWRDRELMRVGYSSLRITHHQAETEAEAVADAIATRLQ